MDRITFEVIRHRLWAINDEQGRMAARLSGAPIIYEAFDLNAALVTADGRGLCCGVYVMHHGATIDHFVRRVLEQWPAEEIRRGDMFFTNDPWWGALHANDGILAMPIFWRGELAAWSGIVMHDSDVGSPVPGSFVTAAADRFGEAPLFPAIKLAEGFVPRPDIERAYLRNSRTPEQNALNMRARVAALRSTHARICELIDRYGLDTFREAVEELIGYVERVLRSRLREIPDGSWSSRGFHDHDGVSDAVHEIRCRLEKRGEELLVDMTGTAPQAPGPINCARPALDGVVAGVMLTFLCHDLPWAIGALAPLLRVKVPDATLVSARSPAPVSMASIMAALSAQDVVADAFARMLEASERHRGEAQASWAPGICGGTFAAGAAISLLSESFGGGGGARTFADGVDSGGVFHSMGSRISNVEALESRGPLLELYRREALDGGGPGRHRGGTCLEYAITPHKLGGDAAASLITRSSGVWIPAGHGLAGGRPGAPARATVLRGSDVKELLAAGRLPRGQADLTATQTLVLAPKALTAMSEGDVLFAANSGGAGYGDPLLRERGAVERDLAAGLVSERGARESYGVVPGDADATYSVRESIRAQRRNAPRSACAARCPTCGRQLTEALTRTIALHDLGPSFSGCLDTFVLTERACPHCATAIAAEVEPAAPAAGSTEPHSATQTAFVSR
ncbi:MAG TPA: hydantoinase B/oxoprolinase family protein [Solirubrobacteraceae bacterium]